MGLPLGGPLGARGTSSSGTWRGARALHEQLCKVAMIGLLLMLAESEENDYRNWLLASEPIDMVRYSRPMTRRAWLVLGMVNRSRYTF